jgi:hypothetical protein
MREPAARRLLELLRAQRLAERERDRHARSSAAWEAASDRLDELNARIWELASSGAEPPETITRGVLAALESAPEEDLEFRRVVLTCLRRAYAQNQREQLTARTADRLASAAVRIDEAVAAMATAQGWLRSVYPEATIKVATADAPGTILVHAERDLHVA